jgi:hypothetical protein
LFSAWASCPGVSFVVIAGLDPAIHDAMTNGKTVRFVEFQSIMDARVKPAHDA